MKLSLDTYAIGTDFTMRTLIQVLTTNRFDGVEFRCESGQKHGVEPEIDEPERRRISTLLKNAGVEVACLSTGQKYDYPDRSQRQQAIDRTKEFIDLAADLDCGRLRVFGNDFPEGLPKSQVIQYVGESLRACAVHAEGTGVDVLLEMHGEFSYWEYCLAAVKAADHPQVAINYNSGPQDVIDGSVAYTFDQVKDYIRHVHLHRLEETRFPYKELFGILKGMDYDGFLSLELGYRGGGEEKVIALYAALYREMVAQV